MYVCVCVCVCVFVARGETAESRSAPSVSAGGVM